METVVAYGFWINDGRKLVSIHRTYEQAHEAYVENGRKYLSDTRPIEVYSCEFLKQILKEGFERIDAAVEAVIAKY